MAARTRHMGVLTKISGDRTRGLAAQAVTSALATCGPVQDVLAQGILDKNTNRGLWMGLTSVVTLARFGPTTQFPARPS